jgi:hypothetical protein
MKHSFATPALTLVLVLTTSVIRADDPGQEYTYNDDWAIVSAPPPPGPYQGINLDPRIPGQEDNVQSHMMAPAQPLQQADRMMGRFMNAPPPAAGQPSIPAQRPVQAARQLPSRHHYRPQHLPRGYGYGYGSRMPGPGASPPALSQGWGRGPADKMEERVPTPAEYNRMTAPPPGPFGHSGGRY